MKEPMELSVDECLNLLANEVFGRLAVVGPTGPRIVPLNYALIDDTIVLRTSPYSELAQHAIGKNAAFEIDEVDHTRQTGWSVVAVGMLEEVEPVRRRAPAHRVGATAVGRRPAQSLPEASVARNQRSPAPRRAHSHVAYSPRPLTALGPPGDLRPALVG